MKRRTILTGVGSMLDSLAGCATIRTETGSQTEAGRQSTDSTRTDSGTQSLQMGDSVHFADDTSLAISSPTVQRSIIADHSAFLSVEQIDDAQFLVVDVTGTAEFEPSNFTLTHHGSVIDPPETQQIVRGVTRSCEGTCIGVPVRTSVTGVTSVSYQENGNVKASWDMGQETIDSISKVPNLLLRNATFVEQDGEVGIEFTVENTGDSNGVFLALVAPTWVVDVEEPTGFSVGKHETVTNSFFPSEIQVADASRLRFADKPTEMTRRFDIELANQ